MATLILPPRHTDDTIALWRAALASSWRTERLASLRSDLPPIEDGDIAIYGEPFFAQTVARQTSRRLLSPPDDWLTKLPHSLLHRVVRYLSLAEARDITVPAFIKPADEKCFPARVYANGSELPSKGELDDLLPCLVSDPVRWESEFRCFMLDNRVATVSVYSRNGDIAQDDEGDWPAPNEEMNGAKAIAEKAADVSRDILPRSVVIDVGWISGMGWGVIEANASWGSGIYGCDPSIVLEVVAAACVV